MAKTGALGQRPANSYEKKLVGIVTVKTGESKAKFTLVDDNKTFNGGSKSLTVALDDLPKHPKLQRNDNNGKELRIRMNSEGTEVEALTPVTGVFDMKLIDLGSREEKDDDPMPYERVFDEGGPKESRHLEFFAVYQIVNGLFKDVKLPAYYLHYKFEEDEDGMTRFAGNTENKKATRLHQLVDWGNMHGLWEQPIAWDDDTILPELLERALEKDVIVRGVFKDGYIRELLPSEDAGNPYGEEEDDDDLSDEVDEMLDETPKKKEKVKPVEIDHKEPKNQSKPVKAVKRIVSKRKSDDDEEL
jgi:hypothetical protein